MISTLSTQETQPSQMTNKCDPPFLSKMNCQANSYNFNYQLRDVLLFKATKDDVKLL
jgi:hypothetical protein